MAFVAALAPYLAAAGSVAGGIQASQSDKYNAAVLGNEQKTAIDQGNAQANLVVRQGRQALGREAAAFGGAGVGYGGSSATSLDQTAVNSELDALNTKYKGVISGYGYGVQSGILNREANQTQNMSVLLAGGQALTGLAKYYQGGLPVGPTGAGIYSDSGLQPGSGSLA
jgi:hypothetical protein